VCLFNVFLDQLVQQSKSRLASSAHCWVLRQHALLFLDQNLRTRSSSYRPKLVLGVGVLRVVGLSWLVFENCIVDASIFDRLWCKLLRAYGGCLGIRSR
jgi:hypothetical protein